MIELNEELQQFLVSPIAIVVGTADRMRTPQICRGWGATVLEDGTSVSLCLDRLPGMRTVTNLRENAQVAVTFTSPVTYRSIQLKGRCIEIGEPDAGDRDRADRHRQAFAATCEPIGLPYESCANMWTTEVIKVTFQPEEAFDQTPGPARGRPL
jgi:hypothetical protein